MSLQFHSPRIGVYPSAAVQYALVVMALALLVAGSPTLAKAAGVEAAPAEPPTQAPPGPSQPQPAVAAPPPATPGDAPVPAMRYPAYYATPDPDDERPEHLPYTQGMPIPSGYRLQTNMPRGYILGGSIVLGVGTAVALVTAASGDPYDFNAKWLYVPVAGPFIAIFTQHDACSPSEAPPHCGRQATTTVVLAMLGSMQALGATLFTYGLTHPRQRLVRFASPQVRIVPATMGTGGYGLTLWGAF